MGIRLEKLLNTLRKTKMVFVNSPEPTGWVMSKKQQEILLNHVREMGCQLISDEVYHQTMFNDDVSPSFLNYLSQQIN